MGKKVKRENAVVISVKSKSILMPSQAPGKSEKVENPRDAVDRIVKLIHHYSNHVRVCGLDELKTFFTTAQESHSFLAMAVPSVLELLFDEERDTRTSVVSFMTTVLQSFPSVYFQSFISIVVTYICSGLTNLSKVVCYFLFVNLCLMICNVVGHTTRCFMHS